MAYRTFAKQAPDDQRATSKINFLNHYLAQPTDSGLYSITNVWYNSNQADFSPRYFRDGVVFVSARDRDLFIKRKSMSAMNEKETPLNAFFVKPALDSAQTMLAQTELFYHKNLNSTYHDGPVSFFEQGSRIAFTRNILRDNRPVRDDKGRINLELYFAKLSTDNEMFDIVPFEFNNTSYSVAHPWIADDGHEMYFSSNMPGGLGGADIYYTQKVNGKWAAPKNLGEPLNTAGDEFYPYLLNDTALVFASNGHGGLGGLDNFVSKKSGSSFSHPVNLGYPLNSRLDDFGLVVDTSGRNGIFASNRPGGMGYDDIYTYSLNYTMVPGVVVERNSKLPIPEATIFVKSVTGFVDSVRADAKGNFRLRLPFDNLFTARAEKDGFTSLADVTFDTRQIGLLADTLEIGIWKNDLHASGLVYSNEDQQLMAGVEVQLENLVNGSIEKVYTNEEGKYRFLVLPDQKYKISASKQGYLPEGFVMNTAGLYKGELLNDLVLEEEFLEKFEIFFEFDKKDIRSEFIKDLDKIVKDLKRAKQATIHVAAHADAQGTIQYNKNLSEARAREVKSYLVNRGISPARINAVGFGEELVLNRCSDGVECSDEEHAKNRRAELKIQNPR